MGAKISIPYVEDYLSNEVTPGIFENSLPKTSLQFHLSLGI